MSDKHQEKISASEVATWLRRHPKFLEHYPDLALSLVVPRDQGKATSLANYQLEILREKNRELTRRLHELFSNAEQNERLAVRTHQLTLALMRAKTPAARVQAMVASLGEDFAGDQIRVVLFNTVAGLENNDWLRICKKSDTALKPFADFFSADEALCGRLNSDKMNYLFAHTADDAQSVALLPIKNLGMIAIASKDANRFYPGMGTLFLRMMSEAFATALALE